MSLEDEKLKLEIAELRQKTRWEPLRGWITMFGVVVLVLGLGVERCSEVERRSFALSLQLHESKIAEMTRISKETTRLCERTATLVRKHDEIRVFGGPMASSLAERISEIEVPVDSEDKERIRQIVQELNNYADALATEIDDYRYWVEALELEADWRLKGSSPDPSFSLHYGMDLQQEWQKVVDTTTKALADAFSIISGDNLNEVDEIIESCLGFITELNQKINVQRIDFCKHYGSQDLAC